MINYIKNFIRAVYKVISIIFALICVTPLVLFAMLSDERGYYNLALFLSNIPFFLGEKMRLYFYKASLKSCGNNIVFKFGSACLYRDIKIHNNITIGLYNLLGKCTIGNNVLMGSYVNITSGSQQHKVKLIDNEAIFSDGKRERVVIGENVWIGNNAVVLASVAKNCVIGTASVVVKATSKNGIYVGNPACRLKDIDAG